MDIFFIYYYIYNHILGKLLFKIHRNKSNCEVVVVYFKILLFIFSLFYNTLDTISNFRTNYAPIAKYVQIVRNISLFYRIYLNFEHRKFL